MGSAAPPSHRIAVVAITALLVGFGLWRAVDLAWICDDAFVSLRYAANLVDGQGLVYNPGERVEGYTNLLWTLALAAGLALGLPDVATAEWLGIACYAALALLLVYASWHRSRHEGTPFLPLAAGVVLVSDDFHQWASGGLETSSFALLALAGLLLSREAVLRGRGTLSAGLVLSLLTLTRPDGLLVAAVAAAGAWQGRGPRSAARLLAPVALTVALWAAFKLAYYGELLPTAFHSKSVLDPYYAQGLVYLGLYLAKNWVVPVAIAVAVVWRLRTPAALTSADRDAAVLAAASLLYLAYVVHVGGDFMFARRIVPALPPLLLAIESVLVRRGSTLARSAVAAAIVAGAALPAPVFDDDEARIRGVADERRFYTERAIALRRAQADAVGRALAGAPVRLMFEGGMCVFGYYSGLPYLVEMSGLTQYSLARLPLERRGWIGHEKQATDAWLSDNDVHLVLSHRFPPIPPAPGRPPIDLVYFGDAAVARIHRYDEALMAHLARQPGVRFVPIERVLERKRAELDRASPERAEEILAWLRRFYLDGAGARGAEIAAELRARIAAMRSEDG